MAQKNCVCLMAEVNGSLDFSGIRTSCVDHTEACLQKIFSHLGLFVTQENILHFE
jgi:hypothetical protein